MPRTSRGTCAATKTRHRRPPNPLPTPADGQPPADDRRLPIGATLPPYRGGLTRPPSVSSDATKGTRAPWLVLAAMSLPLLALSIDMNGLGTLLPAIGAGLGADAEALSWVVNASALTVAALLLLVGRLVPRWGAKRMVLAGVAVFGLASVVCGLAPTVPVLLAGRVGQGLGGVLTFTTSLAIVARAFDDRRRPAAIGVWGFVNGMGGALGPLAGGAAISASSWRGFFLLNVPLCAVALPAIAILTPTDPQADVDDSPVAVPWFALTILGASGVALTLAFGVSLPVGVAASAAIGAVAFVVARRHRAPTDTPTDSGPNRGTSSVEVISPSVANAPLARPSWICAFTANWGFGATLVFGGAYLQQTRGFTPWEAGLIFTSFSLASAVAGLVVGRMARRWGLASSTVAALLLAAITLAGTAALDVSSSLVVILSLLAAGGFAQGLAFDLSTTDALHGVPDATAGEASAVVSVARSFGLTIGVAVGTTLAAGTDIPLRPAALVASGAALLGAAGVTYFRPARGSSSSGPI